MSMLSSVTTHRTVTGFPAIGIAALFARIRENRRAVRDLAMLREIEPHLLADIGFEHLAHEQIQRRLDQAKRGTTAVRERW
jgi:uncharacterized protein YjiS (DUF1127 family)